jgi:hypothetical protein
LENDDEFINTQSEEIMLLLGERETLVARLDGSKDFITKHVEKEIDAKIQK